MVNNLDEVFGSLSDPTRRDILQRLLVSEISINELAKAYKISLPAVSKHIKVLEAAGLIVKERRGRQHFIKLAVANFQNATDHLLYYQTVLDKRLVGLRSYLEEGKMMSEARARRIAKPTEQTLTMTQTFTVPIEKLWEVYIDPKHISKWWGVEGTRLISCYNDVRPGGMFRFTFRGIDELDYTLSGVYQEVVPGERLVYTDGFGEPDKPRPEALNTVTFEALSDGKSRLTKHSTAPRAVHQLHSLWLQVAGGLLG